MLSREEIKKFLSAELEQWSWVKTIPKDSLVEEVNYYYPEYFKQTKYIPFDHQVAGLLLGILNPYFLFFLDLGLGKSRIVLDSIAYWKFKKKVNKTLILVPNVILVSSWVDEIQKHSHLSATELIGTKKEKFEQLNSTDSDLYIVNYQGLQSMLCTIENIKGKKHKKRKVIKYEVDKFVKKFDAVIYDEIHVCKNHRTLTFELCNYLSDHCKIRYGLTGTPFGRDLIDLWAQFYLIDRGETLSSSFGIFRDAYFEAKPNGFGIDYKFITKYEQDLKTRILNKSIRYSETEHLKLPPRIYKKILLHLPEETAPHYLNALKGILDVGNDVIEIGNVFVKLRQICSGFLEFESDKKRITTLLDNPKLEVLLELVTSTPPESKVVIFNEYIRSGDIISQYLEKNNIKYSRLYGGIQDKQGAKDAFLKDKKCKIFLSNLQSGSIGLNLQAANYVIFYETSVSPIIRLQAEKRCHRTGQGQTVFIYDLVMKNTIEERILKFLGEGKDLFKAILESPKLITSILGGTTV